MTTSSFTAHPLGHAQEQQVRGDAVLGTARGRLEDDLVGLAEGAAPAERLLPEAGNPVGVGGVDADALYAQRHAGSLAQDAPRAQAIFGRRRRFSPGRADDPARAVNVQR